jgi:hypothetical protein
LPHVEQHLHDFEFVLMAENPAVSALLHHGQRVPQNQVVDGHAAVDVAGPASVTMPATLHSCHGP